MNRLCTFLFLAFLCSPSSAFAAELLRSYPERNAVLEQPLRMLYLWFDETPDATSAEVSIVGPTDTVRISGLHAMRETDLMAMVDGDMIDGDYHLIWSLGDIQGDIPFTVRRPAGKLDDVWEPPLDIGIVLYDGAEPLDVFGPLEMWMNAGPDNVRVHLIAEHKGPVVLTTTSYPRAIAPRLEAQYDFDDHPDLDVLMVPGGVGTFVELDNPAMLDFLRDAVANVAVATSVCTGVGLYARAGLLDGVAVTGNKVFFDYLVAQGPADWQSEARWVESGRFLTSSGVSAGIDMSLAVIARFFGIELARIVARGTEYEWNEDPASDPFVSYLNSAVPFADVIRDRFVAQDSMESEDP